MHSSYLVIIRHGDELLTAEVSELPMSRRLLEAAARYWAHAFALGPSGEAARSRSAWHWRAGHLAWT